MQKMKIPKVNGTLHRIHLFTDAGIGAVALATILLGEEVLGSLFWQADMVFHVVVFALAFGGIMAERIFHRHKHSGVVAE